jgi:hypothetical protein
MFSIFLNDIEMFLLEDPNACITLDQISMYLLLFADDAVLFPESKEGLQNNISNLQLYCKKC